MKSLFLMFIWLFPIVIGVIISISKRIEIKNASLDDVAFSTVALLMIYLLFCGVITMITVSI